MYWLLFALTCVSSFVCPSLSFLNKGDLQSAVDAFDGFVEPPRSNKASDKDEPLFNITTQDESVKLLEDKPDSTTRKTERIIPVTEVVEEEIVPEKAKCVVGCSVNLNVSNPELIQFANDSFRNIPNSDSFEFFQLIQAVREVQNRIIYYLTVETIKICKKDNTGCPKVSCILKIERHPWRLTKPQLVYQNCTDNSVTDINDHDNSKNLSSGEIINASDHEENSFNLIVNESTTRSDDEVKLRLNEEIIEVANYSVSNRETPSLETKVESYEGAQIFDDSTPPSEDVNVILERNVSSYTEDVISATTSEYESFTLEVVPSDTGDSTQEEISTFETTVFNEITTTTEISTQN